MIPTLAILMTVLAFVLAITAVADVMRQVVWKGSQRDRREWFDSDNPENWQ